MKIEIASVAFLIAATCAAIMGCAMQRGATCMVAAVDEVVNRRRADRLAAMGEAALWVTAGLFIASHVGPLSVATGGYALSLATILGGVLLGAGALINRACLIGTVARFGSGQWAYALTPIGFFVGCLTAGPMLKGMMPRAISEPARLFSLPLWVAVFLAPILIWRAFALARALRKGQLAAHVWSPHLATAIIGVAFVLIVLTVGGWAYTDVLAQWATRGMSMNILAGAALFLALLIGALAGGWPSRRAGTPTPSPVTLARCFTGGGLMGAGSLLVPGGNDGLVLLGLPLLQPHAWAAIGAMIVTIAFGLRFGAA